MGFRIDDCYGCGVSEGGVGGMDSHGREGVCCCKFPGRE